MVKNSASPKKTFFFSTLYYEFYNENDCVMILYECTSSVF